MMASLRLGKSLTPLPHPRDDAELTINGPYRLVRHPIYTGVMAAAVVTAVERASPSGALGAVSLIVGFALVARTEERFLRAQLGAEAYDAYSRRVPMLVPLGR